MTADALYKEVKAIFNKNRVDLKVSQYPSGYLAIGDLLEKIKSHAKPGLCLVEMIIILRSNGLSTFDDLLTLFNKNFRNDQSYSEGTYELDTWLKKVEAGLVKAKSLSAKAGETSNKKWWEFWK